MHLRHWWVLLLVGVTCGSAVGWNYEEEEKEQRSLMASSGDSAGDTGWKPGTPSTWICYSTAGSKSEIHLI